MNFLRTLKSRIGSLDRDACLALVLFALTAFLLIPELFPTLRDINLQDESIYLNTGRFWLEGQPPLLARNPLIGVLYGAAYLIFMKSPLWMMQSAAFGRIIIAALIWLSGLLIARQLARYFHPAVFLGLFLIFPLIPDILGNSSDGLFAAMSGLAFWQMLAYFNGREIRNLWLGSAFVGLAALSRNDGLVLFVVFLALSLVLTARQKLARALLAGALPFVLIVGGYVLFYGLSTGDFELGTGNRSYVAFMQGQQLVYQRSDCDMSYLKCAALSTDQVYGSAADNNYSVLSAISRNPGAFLQRAWAIFIGLPGMLNDAYGIRTTVLLILLAGRGMYELVRRKDYKLLACMLFWLAYLGVYFLTFIRQGYLQSPYYVVFSFAAIGVQALAANLDRPREVQFWTAGLALLSIGGIVLDVQVLYFTTILLLAAMWIGRLAVRSFDGLPHAAALPLLVFAAAGLMIRGNYLPPVIPRLGDLPEEQAIVLLQQRFTPETKVAAGAPGPVLAARMEYVKLGDPTFDSQTGDALYQKLVKANVRAIYVDHNLSSLTRNVWALIEPDIGTKYEEIFSGREGSIRVLILK